MRHLIGWQTEYMSNDGQTRAESFGKTARPTFAPMNHF
jgi:hypothetical protein